MQVKVGLSMSIRAELVLTKLVNIAYVESRNIQDEDIQLNCVSVYLRSAICLRTEDRNVPGSLHFVHVYCVFRRREAK